MADFKTALEATLKHEGGYAFDPQDPGGETYKGIARERNPKWKGWMKVDLLRRAQGFPRNLDQDDELQRLVGELYELNYWHKIQGDEIADQDMAEAIFDFAVNAGPITSAKLAQATVGAEPDGVIGPDTVARINAEDKRTFLALFTLSKIGRYVGICQQRADSRKYFFGWVRRALEGV